MGQLEKKGRTVVVHRHTLVLGRTNSECMALVGTTYRYIASDTRSFLKVPFREWRIEEKFAATAKRKRARVRNKKLGCQIIML